ncbi:hypothetical protein BGZ98_004830 [Dissophora globulifera]|nr:hypothetical protein BGZ98_004830 [Dissophora globulifera]
MTPHNVFFGNTVVVTFFLQFAIFYSMWFFCPSLTKNRRGLAWVLTFFCAVSLLIIASFEVGYLRTTLWHILGWGQHGPGAATATVFTYWIPGFHEWIFQIGNAPGTPEAVTLATLKASLTSVHSAKLLFSNPHTYKDLAGEYLRWFITLPIFSLAPFKPPHLISATAPYYLGGGGRILFSLENFPRETRFSSAMCGYFVGYCLGDLIIGSMHYREHVDPFSGWFHHIIYTFIIYRLCRINMLSEFLIAGAPVELSTVFLASGFMFPHLREDFWFPTTFFLVRIVYVIFMWHETVFNFPTPTGGSAIYFASLLVHIFWFSKYLKGLRRRKLRAKKSAHEKEATRSSIANGDSVPEGTTASLGSAPRKDSTFRLRVKKDK